MLVAVRPEEFVLAADGQQGIDATVTSSVFLGLNTTYFVELYDGTRLRGDFARIESRLIEMQSREYLAEAHKAAALPG